MRHKIHYVLFKVVHAFKPGSDVHSMFHQVFELSIAMNDLNSQVATITILQKHSIQCSWLDNSASWYSFKDTSEKTNGSCILTFYPILYHGIDKNPLPNAIVSKCPIEIADASKCNNNSFSIHSSVCNAIDFKLRIDATAIEKLLVNRSFENPSYDSKNNLDKDQVNLITSISIHYKTYKI